MEQLICQLLLKLRIEFFVGLLLPPAVLLAGETPMAEEGALAADGQGAFVANTVAILLMLVAAPLCLRLFALNTRRNLRRYTLDGAVKAYHVWSLVRVAGLSLCGVAGAVAYWLTLTTGGLLCAAIAVVLMLYCWPSKEKIVVYLEEAKEESAGVS